MGDCHIAARFLIVVVSKRTEKTVDVNKKAAIIGETRHISDMNNGRKLLQQNYMKTNHADLELNTKGDLCQRVKRRSFGLVAVYGPAHDLCFVLTN